MLVVSHDFPPMRSPQAIRALAFVRRLAAHAEQVHVLTRTRLPGLAEPDLPGNVRLHRASPGVFENTIDRIGARRHPPAAAPTPTAAPVATPAIAAGGPASLNWKGRLVGRARRWLDRLRFPDGRVAWVAPARRELARLCEDRRPDVALVMHEPAAGLLLGEALTQRGIPWLADLADPVLAPYTPWHWRRAARRLERRTLREAGAASATNAATADLLVRRHGPLPGPIAILPQGFDATTGAELPAAPAVDAGPLRLVYTGRFYAFRDPSALLQAVLSTPGVRLDIAGPEMPATVLAAAARRPDAVRLLGELDHARARALQAQADVLVSLGNAGTEQSPGKVHEYFGAGRPLLHLHHGACDPVPEQLAALGRGLACRNEAAAIAEALGALVALKSAGRLDQAFDLSPARVAEYRWDRIGDRLVALLAGLVVDGRGRD